MTPFAISRSHPTTVGHLRNPSEALAAAAGLVPRLAERAEAHDLAGEFPWRDLDDLRQSGLLGLMVPERLDGAGASFLDYARVALVLGEANGSTALIFNMHAAVTGALARTPDEVLRALGADDAALAARDAALAAARDGAQFSVAMSERGVGSRLSQLATTYRRVGDGFSIAGTKSFVSGAAGADAYLVAARRTDDGAAAAVVSYFLVPAGTGVSVAGAWDALGMRASASDDLVLDVVVGPEALVGGVEGTALLFANLMPQWLVASYAAVYVGVARAAIAALVEHAASRSLHELPAVRARVGRADAAVAAAELVVLEAARRVDEAPGTPEANRAVWRAKLVAGETAMNVAGSMLEAAGAGATRRGHRLERLYRDARCGSLQPATSDVCADWLGLAALGRDPNFDADRARW